MSAASSFTSLAPVYWISFLDSVKAPDVPRRCKCRGVKHPLAVCPEPKPDRDEGKLTEQGSYSWTDICSLVSEPSPLDPKLTDKGNLEAVAPGRYSNRRRKTDLIGRQLVWIDSDEVTDIDAVIGWLRSQGVASAIHTTFSSPNADGTLRIRVIVPLSREVNASEWDSKIKGWMRKMPGAVADGNALDATRFLYLPVLRDGYEHWIIEGKPLDVDALPVDISAPRAKAPNAGNSEPLTFGTLDERYREAAIKVGEAWATDLPTTGHRDEAAGALASCVSKKGVPDSQVPDFVVAAARAAGFGSFDNKRKWAETTVQSLREDKPVTGWDRLKALCPTVVRALDETLLTGLEGLIVPTTPSAANDTGADETPKTRYGIGISTELHENVEAACIALEDEKNIYQRSGRLVRVIYQAAKESDRESGSGTPTISELRVQTLKPILTSVAEWTRKKLKFDADGNVVSCKSVAAMPSEDIVSGVLHEGRWSRVKVLAAISETPVIRADGSILQTAGYDPTTGYLYKPSQAFPEVPLNPTHADARAALAELREVFADFSYVNEAARYVPIAAVLSIVGRPAIEGAVPLFVFDASTRGSGKSLQTDAVSIIATGRLGAKANWTKNEEEIKKTLETFASEGATVFSWDNVPGGLAFGNSHLDASLTNEGTMKFRILGRTESKAATWSAVQMATE